MSRSNPEVAKAIANLKLSPAHYRIVQDPVGGAGLDVLVEAAGLFAIDTEVEPRPRPMEEADREREELRRRFPEYVAALEAGAGTVGWRADALDHNRNVRFTRGPAEDEIHKSVRFFKTPIGLQISALPERIQLPSGSEIVLQGWVPLVRARWRGQPVQWAGLYPWDWVSWIGVDPTPALIRPPLDLFREWVAPAGFEVPPAVEPPSESEESNAA